MEEPGVVPVAIALRQGDGRAKITNLRHSAAKSNRDAVVISGRDSSAAGGSLPVCELRRRLLVKPGEESFDQSHKLILEFGGTEER